MVEPGENHKPIGTKQEILALIDKRSDDLRRMGVRRIGLFGSYSAGKANPGSDLDFLVSLERNSFDDYMDVKFFLEDLFGRDVDLVIEADIKPRLRDRILKEVVYAQGL